MQNISPDCNFPRALHVNFQLPVATDRHCESRVPRGTKQYTASPNLRLPVGPSSRRTERSFCTVYGYQNWHNGYLEKQTPPHCGGITFGDRWCLRTDSNRHGDKPQGILSPLCLPNSTTQARDIVDRQHSNKIAAARRSFNLFPVHACIRQ